MISQIKNIFPPLDGFKVEDSFSNFNINYNIDLNSSIDSLELINLLENISDNWILNIEIENFDSPIQLNHIGNIDNFKKEIEEEKEKVEEEKVTLSLNIDKSINSDNMLFIYDEDAFFNAISKLKVTEFLNAIVFPLKKDIGFTFKLYQTIESNISFCSKAIFYNTDTVSNYSLKDISDNCYYANKQDYPFSPDHFQLVKSPDKKNPLSIMLEKCNMLFNIISIADYTAIKDNNLSYKIIGYRTFENKIDCDNISIQSNKTYNKIFDWIYSDYSNVPDKLGLARNILSIYLKKNSIEVNEDAFFSIQSGFKTYIQGNLNKYIDLRSKITDQLELINKKANTTLDQILSNYQKSNYAFISFFISIFVLRVLVKGNFENVFTKDATVILVILIIISGIYLAYSLWLFNSEKSRLKKRYENLKSRFEDLLIKEDINKILRSDNEFNDEMSFITKKRNVYTGLWVLTILLFLILLLELSSYFNWQSISDYFQNSTQD